MFKNVIGLVVEYNPFHNGHLHHIQEIDKLFEDNIKIAVMSGDFVQRGEPSLINKFEKTKIALSQGTDIVIELPVFYSSQSAEIFAKGSVSLLDKLSCSHMVFGSESNDLDKLKKIANLSLTDEFTKTLKEFLDRGFSYPTAFSKAISDEKFDSNDILALEYLKAIETIDSKIEACSIKREKTGYYDDEKDNFASASYIRKVLLALNETKENKLNKKIRLITLISLLSVINLVCYFSENKGSILFHLNALVIIAYFLIIITSLYLIIFKKKTSYFKFILLVILFLALSFLIIMITVSI